MNIEEIENRIIICEERAKGYREVGKNFIADKYDNEKYKWEKLLSDLDLLNERKIMELLEYKRGYFNLQQELTDYKERNEKAIEYIKELDDNTDDITCYDIDRNTRDDLLEMLDKKVSNE